MVLRWRGSRPDHTAGREVIDDESAALVLEMRLDVDATSNELRLAETAVDEYL